MGAFEDAAKFIFSDAMEMIKADIEGKHRISRVPIPDPIKWLVYEVIQDFEYNHNDQDIHNGIYKFKKGEEIKLRAEIDPMYFMQNRSKLKLVREEWEEFKR